MRQRDHPIPNPSRCTVLPERRWSNHFIGPSFERSSWRVNAPFTAPYGTVVTVFRAAEGVSVVKRMRILAVAALVAAYSCLVVEVHAATSSCAPIHRANLIR